MNKKYNFVQLLEGVAKFNIVFFVVALIFMFFSMISSDHVIQMYEEQLGIIFFSVLFGKIYQKAQNYKFLSREIKLKSLMMGYTIYLLIYILIDFLLSKNFNEAYLKSRIISLLAGYIYWLTVIWLARSKLMQSIVKYLHGTLEYKNLYQLFIMFNIVFFVLILVMISVGMIAGRSLFESIFVIMYFEAAFLVFHVFIAKIFDYVWSKENYEQKKVSVLGLYVASIFYVVKVHLVDETIIGIGRASTSMPVFAVGILILFWTFFIILFHFEIKYPNKKH